MGFNIKIHTNAHFKLTELVKVPFFFNSHQERTEEDEGDKVSVGEGAATFRLCVP